MKTWEWLIDFQYEPDEWFEKAIKKLDIVLSVQVVGLVLIILKCLM